MLDDGTLVCDQFDILNESKSFYEKLYSKREEIIRENINESLSHFEFPKLTTKSQQPSRVRSQTQKYLIFFKK